MSLKIPDNTFSPHPEERAFARVAKDGRQLMVRDARKSAFLTRKDEECGHTCWPPLMWISAPFTYELVSVHST
jgi:hypothetical protein